MVGAAKREGREVIDFDEQAVTLRRSLNVMIEVRSLFLLFFLPSSLLADSSVGVFGFHRG